MAVYKDEATWPVTGNVANDSPHNTHIFAQVHYGEDGPVMRFGDTQLDIGNT